MGMKDDMSLDWLKKAKNLEYEGWITLGLLNEPGNRWRVQVWYDPAHPWCLVELWVKVRADIIPLDNFIIDLDSLRPPPDGAHLTEAQVAFEKALARKLERPVAERLLAWRAPAPPPPAPLIKRLARTVLTWIGE